MGLWQLFVLNLPRQLRKHCFKSRQGKGAFVRWKKEFRRREENVTHPQNGLLTSKLSELYSSEQSWSCQRDQISPDETPRACPLFQPGLGQRSARLGLEVVSKSKETKEDMRVAAADTKGIEHFEKDSTEWSISKKPKGVGMWPGGLAAQVSGVDHHILKSGGERKEQIW